MTRNWLTPSGRLGSPGTCGQHMGPGEQKVSVLVQKPVGSGLQEGPHCSLSLKAGKDCPCVRAPGHPRSGWSPSSEAMATEVLLKHTRQTSRANTLAQYGALEGAGRRLAMARAGLLDTPEVAGPGLGWPGLPGPGRSRLPDASAILLLSWPLLWVGSVALALPQEQVAFAAWHLSLEGGCQQGANLGISLCVLWVLAQGLFAPGGVRPGPSWWRASERGSSSLPRAPPTPQLSLSR